MNTQRLLGRLAAACLLVSSVSVVASAQARKPVYSAPKPAYRQPAPVNRGYTNSYKPATSGVKFGLRAGLNVADVQGDAVQSFNTLAGYAPTGSVTQQMRPSFYAGLYATLPITPNFAIEPGLTYSEKGTVLRGKIPVEALDFLNTQVTATGRLSYLDIPVLAKLYVTPGFYVYAGPQASVLLNANARLKASVLGFNAYQQDFDVKSALRPVDFAVVGGIGYQSASGFGLSAGYDYGLTSLDKNNYFQAYNRVLKVGVNYSF